MLTAQHRWDSGAFALASIALCVARAKRLWRSSLRIPDRRLRCTGYALGRRWLHRDVGLVGIGLGRRRRGISLGLAIAGTSGDRRALAQRIAGRLSRTIGLAFAKLYRGQCDALRKHHRRLEALFKGASGWELAVRALHCLLPGASRAAADCRARRWRPIVVPSPRIDACFRTCCFACLRWSHPTHPRSMSLTWLMSRPCRMPSPAS